MAIDIGDLVRVPGAFTDATTGADVDPDTVALTVKDPAGTLTTYTLALGTVTKDSAGHYHVDVNATASGTWWYRWASTGTGQAAEEGSFEVLPSSIV